MHGNLSYILPCTLINIFVLLRAQVTTQHNARKKKIIMLHTVAFEWDGFVLTKAHAGRSVLIGRIGSRSTERGVNFEVASIATVKASVSNTVFGAVQDIISYVVLFFC